MRVDAFGSKRLFWIGSRMFLDPRAFSQGVLVFWLVWINDNDYLEQQYIKKTLDQVWILD